MYKRTEQEMLAEAMDALIQEGSITNLSPGGRVRTLLEVMNRELGLAYRNLEFDEAMRLVSTSTGQFLDLVGELLQVNRGEPISAYSGRADQNVKFYTTGAPLITYLPSGTIPTGTTISTSDGILSYSVSEATTFSTVQTEVYVAIEASGTGVSNNVGSYTLTEHDLGVSQISVTNLYSIGNGEDSESDENYRFRITNAMQAYSRANDTAIRLAALGAPGVSDVIIQNYRSGVGTVDVLVIPVGNKVSDITMRQVKSAVGAIKASGIYVSARQPSYIPVQIAVRLDTSAAATPGQASDIKEEVVNSILRYIGQIPLGGAFILNELRERVMSTSEKIRDMEILCYVFRNRPQLKRNFKAEPDELFLPDPDTDTPILAL